MSATTDTTTRPPMFSDADRLRLFTRQELGERLGGTCSVDWFLRAFRIPVRCKNRVVCGSDVLRALEAPPAAADEAEPEAAVPATVETIHGARRTKLPGKRQDAGTCAGIQPLTIGGKLK